MRLALARRPLLPPHRWLCAAATTPSQPAASGGNRDVLSATASQGVKGGSKEGDGFPSSKAVKWCRSWRRSKAKAVLVLDIDGQMSDVRTPSPLEKFSANRPPPTQLGALSALRRAAADEQVACVYIRIGRLGCGMARVEELCTAIRKCVEVKPVVCYLEAGSEDAIALGAACSELHLAPGGYYSVSGFANRFLLLRGLLNKLGLEPEVTQIGKWKGGHVLSADPGPDGVPAEVRAQTEGMIASARQRYIEGIVHDCGQSISAEEVDTLLAEGAMGGKLLYAHHAGSADGGEEAAGKLRPMFTSLAYEDELMHKLLARAGGQADPSNSSSPTKPTKAEKAKMAKKKNAPVWLPGSVYVAQVKPEKLGLCPKKKGLWGFLTRQPKPSTIAVVPLSGQISAGGNGGGRQRSNVIYAEPVVETLRLLAERPDVKAVVLRVDSPGGDALASESIWRAACLLGQSKPLVASMGSVAASGGYFIPMACQHIVALPSTITGACLSLHCEQHSVQPARSTDVPVDGKCQSNYMMLVGLSPCAHRINRRDIHALLCRRAAREAGGLDGHHRPRPVRSGRPRPTPHPHRGRAGARGGLDGGDLPGLRRQGRGVPRV